MNADCASTVIIDTHFTAYEKHGCKQWHSITPMASKQMNRQTDKHKLHETKEHLVRTSVEQLDGYYVQVCYHVTCLYIHCPFKLVQ